MEHLQRTVTLALSALIALAWLVTAFAWSPEDAALAMGFIPARLYGDALPFAAVPAFLTPLSSTLVHAGLVHLGFNLLIFLWCGAMVERVLGKSGLVILFVVGAYAAAAGQWIADPMAAAPMIGASGAISAVIGAYSLSFGRAKAVTKSPALNRWINAAWLMAAWIAMQLMIGYLAGAQGVLLATAAHIGGFLAGLLLQRPLLLWRYRSA
jgi:membrane associated rhomboid family serine protease